MNVPSVRCSWLEIETNYPERNYEFTILTEFYNFLLLVCDLDLVCRGGVFMGNTGDSRDWRLAYVIICLYTAWICVDDITKALKIGILHEFLWLLRRKSAVGSSSWVMVKFETRNCHNNDYSNIKATVDQQKKSWERSPWRLREVTQVRATVPVSLSDPVVPHHVEESSFDASCTLSGFW